MYLKKIKLNNFRNFEKIEINLINGINIFYGNNAQGKSNLLESIYLLGLLQSYRTNNLNNLIKFNNNYFKISGYLIKKIVNYKLEIISNINKKEIFVDNKKIKKISDYIENIKVIIFSPEDFNLIKNSPEYRRKYFDIQIQQLNSKYIIALNSYNKFLKIRNSILKEKLIGKPINYEYFNIITNCLIDRSVIIMKNRYKYIEKINSYSEKIYNELFNINNFNIYYKNNYNIDLELSNEEIINKLKDIYQKNLLTEITIGKTISGCHMDDYDFRINLNSLKNYGSQGQQRIAILSMKLSEIEIFKNYFNDNPILLLDDIFSELDKIKKNNILKYIDNSTQIIITTNDIKNLDKSIIEKSKKFIINNGKIEER